MFVYYINSIRNRFLLRSRHVGVKKKRQSLELRLCTRRQEACVLFLIKFLFGTNVLLCWPVERSCYNINKLETEVANPWYLLH